MKNNFHTIESTPNFRIVISDEVPQGQHARVYNAPSVTELAAIITGDENATDITKNRQVVIRNIGGGLESVPSNHTSYDPLSYVLTHMHSDKGWTYSIPTLTEHGELHPSKFVTPMDYYSYRLQLRDPRWTIDSRSHKMEQDVLSFGRLLCDQYWVDQWVKTEEQCLRFISNNQATFKQEIYKGLADAVRANEHRDAGTYVVNHC